MAYTRIITATSTNVLTKPGIVNRIIINKALIGTVDLYDHPSANSNPIGSLAIGHTPMSKEYMVTVQNGLRIVTSAADDILVITDESVR